MGPDDVDVPDVVKQRKRLDYEVMRRRLDALEQENSRLRLQVQQVVAIPEPVTEQVCKQVPRVPFLSFEEDSPYLEEQIEQRMARCALFSQQMNRIGAATRKWQKRCMKMQHAERELAKQLSDAAHSAASTGETDFFEHSARLLSQVLFATAESRELSLARVEATLLRGVDGFEQNDLTVARECHRLVRKARSDYESAQRVFLASKRPSRNFKTQTACNNFLLQLAARESDTIAAHERYELARLDLTRQLNLVELKRQSELAKLLCDASAAIQSSAKRESKEFVTVERRESALRANIPTVLDAQSKVQESFTQLRASLSSALCRSVKLSSSPVPHSNAAAGEPEQQDHEQVFDDDDEPSVQTAKSQHARASSSIDKFVKRLAVRTSERMSRTLAPGSPKASHTLGENSDPIPSTNTNRDRASTRLSTAGSFVLLKSSPPLREILTSSNVLPVFLQFAIAQVDAGNTSSVSHIAFWLEVERFRLLSDARQRTVRAGAMMEKYLTRSGSSYQIALSDRRKATLAQAFAESTAKTHSCVQLSFFDQVQDEVQDILAADTYTQFLRSDMWQGCRFLKVGSNNGSCDTISSFDTATIERLLSTSQLLALQLIGCSVCVKGDDGQRARTIVDNNSRVIMHGRYDPLHSELFSLEYSVSTALSLLHVDLAKVYAKAASEEAAIYNAGGVMCGFKTSIFSGEPHMKQQQQEQQKELQQPLPPQASLIVPTDPAPATAKPPLVTSKAARMLGLSESENVSTPSEQPPRGQQAIKSRMRTWAKKRFSISSTSNIQAGRNIQASQELASQEYQQEVEEIALSDAGSDDEAGSGASDRQVKVPLYAPTLLSPNELQAPGSESGSVIVKQGYLRRRSAQANINLSTAVHGIRKAWRRVWLVLREKRLYCVKDISDRRNGWELICECMLATVREADPATVNDMQFCFEVLSPQYKQPVVLQAESLAAMREWIDEIRRCTEQMINGLGAENSANSSKKEAVSGENTLNSEEINGDSWSAVLQPKSDGSSPPLCSCADCGHSQPEWAVANLGLLVCIECSGIHRSLGVHISKVRSLTLDSWPEASKVMLSQLGNATAAQIWEADIENLAGWKKPTPDAPRAVKERFIKAKYMWKGFCDPRPIKDWHPAHSDAGTTGMSSWCGCGAPPRELFLKAVSRSDAPQVMWYVVRGALDDFLDPQDPQPSTPLHEAAKCASLVVCEIILQNGGKRLLKVGDLDGRTPLQLANDSKVVSLLSSCA